MVIAAFRNVASEHVRPPAAVVRRVVVDLGAAARRPRARDATIARTHEWQGQDVGPKNRVRPDSTPVWMDYTASHHTSLRQSGLLREGSGGFLVHREQRRHGVGGSTAVVGSGAATGAGIAAAEDSGTGCLGSIPDRWHRPTKRTERPGLSSPSWKHQLKLDSLGRDSFGGSFYCHAGWVFWTTTGRIKAEVNRRRDSGERTDDRRGGKVGTLFDLGFSVPRTTRLDSPDDETRKNPGKTTVNPLLVLDGA